MRGGMSTGQSTPLTKHYKKVVRKTKVPETESRLIRLWRKVRGGSPPMRVIETEELVEIIPQDPPQPVRGHVSMIGKK